MKVGCAMQVAKLDQDRQLLTARVSQTQSGCSQLAMQLKETRERWQITCLTNATLHKELMALREMWQVPCSCTSPVDHAILLQDALSFAAAPLLQDMGMHIHKDIYPGALWIVLKPTERLSSFGGLYIDKNTRSGSIELQC